MRSKYLWVLTKTGCRYLAILNSILLVVQIMAAPVSGAPVSFMSRNNTPEVYALSGSQNSIVKASAIDGAQVMEVDEIQAGKPALTDLRAEGSSIEIPAAGSFKKESVTVMAAAYPAQQEQSTTNEIVVKYRTASEKTLKSGPMGEFSIMQAQSVEAAGTTLVKVNSGEDISAKLKEIRSDPQVEYAEPNYRLYAAEVPNDPRYSEQWALMDNAYLYAPQAWSSALGISGSVNNATPVVMAILDTGIDYNHEDLIGRVEQNGFNAISGETVLSSVMDDSISGHGTLVAGIAAAATNNGIGISGTAAEFPVKILPVKVLDRFGTGTMLSVAQGIRWAADNGAKVINLSLGARLPDYPNTLAEAVKYAQDKGILVVAAGGNDGENVEGFYPACLPGVISVGSTDNQNKNTDFTTYDCTIYAPGVSILSTLPSSIYPGEPGRYGTMTGSSASAPMASATCALLWSVYPQKSADMVGDSVRYGYKYYGYPNYSTVLSLLNSFRNATNGYQTYNEIWFLSPDNTTNMAGTVELAVQVENPDETAKVDFYYGTGKYDEASYTLIGSVVNDGSRQSGIYSVQFDTTALNDGMYYLKAVGTYTGNQYMTTFEEINVYNQQKSGLSIKVLKPDNTAGAGAKVTVWHIMKNGTDVIYEPIAYNSFTADNNGGLIIPGGVASQYYNSGFATDGNDYLITARGTDPNYLYYKTVRAPAKVVMDSTDAKKVVISGKSLEGNPLAGATIMTDRQIDISQSMYYESEYNEITHVPVATLNAEGNAEVYLADGIYDLRLLDAANKYFLTKDNIIVSDTATNVSFLPKQNEVSMLKLTPDPSDNITSGAILLKNGSDEELIGFELSDMNEKVVISPGSYSACISALYADGATPDKYWKWDLEVPDFNVTAGNTHQIVFGGNFEGTANKIKVSSIGPNSIFHPDGIIRNGCDAWFSATLIDAKGNSIIGLYNVSQPDIKPTSQSTILKKAAGDSAYDNGDTSKALENKNLTYSYNWETAGFEAVSETDVYPKIYISNISDTLLTSKDTVYSVDSWITYWLVPASSSDVQYKAWVNVSAGVLGSSESEKYIFTAKALPSIPSQKPDLNVTVTDREGNPMQEGNILLLHKEGNSYKRISTSDYGITYGIKRLSQGMCSYYNTELIPGDEYALVLYGKSKVPGLMTDTLEPLFLYKTFIATSDPMQITIYSYDYNLKKINLKPKDQENVSFSISQNSKKLEYWAYAITSGGVAVGMFLSSDDAANDMSLWVPSLNEGNPANYVFQITSTERENIDSPQYLMNKALSIPSAVPETGLDVILGGSDLARISFGESFSNYTLGGFALFDNVLKEAVVFHPFDMAYASSIDPVKSMNDLYVSSGSYMANVAVGQNGINGSWAYWLERNISLSPGADFVWNDSDQFTARLETDLSEYRPGETAVFTNTIEDSYGSRLNAACTGYEFNGGIVWSSLELDQQKDISAQNHYEIAPFITVKDATGNEVLRYKQPSISSYNFYLWNNSNYNDNNNNIPILLTRADNDNTYFKGSYTVPSDASGGNYSAWLEFGAGPNGIIKSQTVNFKVLAETVPFINLDQPASPVKNQTTLISGTANPGALVEISYNNGAATQNVIAGTVTAGEDGKFTLENIPLQNEGEYVFKGAIKKDNATVKESLTVTIIVDRTAPSMPGNFKTEGQNETTIALTWEEASDNDVIAGYRIARNGVTIKTLGKGELLYTDSNLQKDIDYQYEIYAFDRAGNESQKAAVSGRTLSTGDTKAPTVPTNLTIGIIGGIVTLKWNASTDNIGVSGYKVLRSSESSEPDVIGNTDAATLTYTDTGLFAETTYTYYVKAYDEKGNESGLSEAKIIKTPGMNISGISWRLPRKTINGLAYSNDTIALTMSGDKNRIAETVITYTSWYDDKGALLEQPDTYEQRVSMAEDAIVKGLYRGSYVINPGVSQIASITAVLSDGGGHNAVKQSDRLPLGVAGGLVVNLIAQPGANITPEDAISFLKDTGLALAGCNNTSFAAVNINNGLASYTMEGLAPADDYVLTQRYGFGGKISEAQGISIKNGLNTTLDFVPKLPASLNVRVLDEVYHSPVKDVGVYCYIKLPDYRFVAYGTSGDDGLVKNSNASIMPLLRGMKSGDEVKLNVSIKEELYSKYNVNNLTNYQLVLNAGENSYDILLKRHNFVELQGNVTSTGNIPVEGVLVTAVQRLEGQYYNLYYTAVTDSNGHYTMQVLPQQATVIFTHPKAETVTKRIQQIIGPVDAQLELLGLIRLNVFTKMAGDAEERPLEIDWRVGVHFNLRIENKNTARSINQSGTDWPYLKVKGSPGDTISISLSGREAEMNDKTIEVTLNENMYAEADVHLVENGKIALRLLDQFGNSINGYTRTMEVYKADEQNARRYSALSSVNSDFEAKLPDGLYTLVFYWGPARNYSYNSTWSGYWNINNWSQLYQEGVDFTRVNNVEVRQGEITDIGDVFLDKVFSLSQGYFAGKEGNSFTPNNIEAVPGNTVTLTASYNYDETQSVHPKNVKLKLAIPENSELIENNIWVNVQKGNSDPPYTKNPGYIEVDLGDAVTLENGVLKGLKGTVTYQVKLDQNPDSSRCGTRAWMEFFGQRGNTIEELGTVIIKMPFVTISAPTEVSSDNTERTLKVYGRAPAGTTVSIYDGYNLVGEALSTEFGVWRADITLVNRGKPATHFLSAKITGDGENEITSQIIKVTYGTNSPILTSITMYQKDGRHVTIDPSQGVASFPYVFVPNMPFTFETNFSNNASVENVQIIARNGAYIHKLNATYNAQKDCFIAEGNLTNGYNADPGTIFVEYTIKEQGYIPPEAAPNEQQEREAMPEVWRDAEYSFDEGTPDPNAQFDNNGLLRIPPVTVTLKNVSRYISQEGIVNASNFAQSSLEDSDDIKLKVSMEVQYLEDLGSTNVFGTMPLYGGMSVCNTVMSMSGDTYTLSFIAPMKALCENSAVEQMIRSQDVNINIESGYGKVTVKTSQIGGAYKLFDTVKSGFDFKNKLEDLNTFLEGAVGCSPNARGYYEQRAQDLADSAFTNLCVKYATTLAGIAFASTGVGIVGTVAISAVGGIGNYVAEKRWQNSFKDIKAELASDDDCKDDEDEDNDDNDEDEDDDNDKDDRDDNGNRKKRKKAARPKYIWDPSGYVYEVIPENRLQGVTATAMYKDAKTDEWKVWDAIWYLQENPLITDNEGRYAWDVPQGEWKVAYEKQDYEIAYSDVLTVPPPQTEVNISMISTKAPEVNSIVSEGREYIDITFSKFMKVDTLTSYSIAVTPLEEGAEALEGILVSIDPVTDSKGIVLAKAVRFTPTTPMNVNASYKVSVNKLIQCYADIFMEADAEKTIVVTQGVIHVENVSLDKNTIVLDVGGTSNLIATITPSDATDTRVTWNSDKPWVAEVDENGKITAKASGTALITVTTVDGNKTASCNVTVNQPVEVPGNNYIPSVPVKIPATGLELDKTHLTLDENGEPFKLTVKILPANTTETEVIWTSSDEAVATVDNGLVTPLKPGEADITVSLKNGSVSKVCKVTVKAGNVLKAVIGKEAQYVKAFNDEVVLYLEEDTFPEGTTLTITKIEEGKVEEKPDSARFTYKGASYEIDANGVEPKKPVRIIVKYDTSALNGIDPMKLGIYRQEDDDSSLWIYKGGAVNTKEGTVETWLLSFSRYAVMASGKTFEDIKTHWSRSSIEVLASRSIINGVNDIEFQPERPITRAEMAKMLVTVLKSDARKKIDLISPETQTFEDVKAGEWYYKYVETAAFYGLVKGDNGRFRPDDLIRREEMALMVIRMLNTEEELSKVSSSSLNYSDANDLSAWAKEAVTLANQKGIVLGDETGNFNPKEPALRGQVAAVIVRAMEQLGLMTQLVEIKGKVALSEVEGRHFELNTCPKCKLPPVYVLLPMDDVVAAKLEMAVGKKVEVKAILMEGSDTYMRGPVIKIVSIDIKE